MKISRLPEPQRLWNELLKVSPTNENLCTIVIQTECLRVVAGRKLLGNNPTNEQLCCIIKHVPLLSVAAAHQLLRKNPTEDQLRYIVEHVEALRSIAEGRLPKRSIQEVLSDISSALTGNVQSMN